MFLCFISPEVQLGVRSFPTMGADLVRLLGTSFGNSECFSVPRFEG